MSCTQSLAWNSFVRKSSLIVSSGYRACRSIAANLQFDSVYVFKDKITDRSRDTLYIREVQTEYKYRILRDTILKVQHDSIPYEVTKIVTKEIQRPLTWFDHLTRWSFFFLIGALLTFLFIKIKRVFKY